MGRIAPPSEVASGGLMTPLGVTCAGLAGNVLLSGGKVVAGLAFGSQTLVADGLHSASDLASDFAVLAGLRVSNRPADPSHPYGHRRVQTLVSMFIGLLLVAAAAWIAYEAASTWQEHHARAYGWWPFVIAMTSVVTKEGLYRITRTVGRRCGDMSIVANAWHHRSDAFSSIAAAAGMFGVALGGPEWGFLDHFTAIALSALLIAIGLKLAFSASEELIDRAPDRRVMESVGRIVEGTEGVRSYHAFRMRQLGGKREMDVHVQVDPALTVAQGHDIATEVRRRIWEADPNVTNVIVHVEPVEEPGPTAGS